MACWRAPGRRRATGRWFRTSGRRAGSRIRRTRAAFIWDLGRVPYDPEDCYISELVACLSEISEGITCGTDTSQANHTPEHTDAMIKGLMDSGRRMVFDYSGGTNRSAEGIPYEVPGAMNDTTKGIGRLAKTYFSSKDQLVTLGFAGGAGPAFPGAAYTGMAARPLVRRVDQQPQRRQPDGDRQCGRRRRGTAPTGPTSHSSTRTRWQDEPVAQIGAGSSGYPNSQPIESVGHLPRPGRACLNRQPHRDADAARDAAVSAGAESRHPAQPEPRRRHEHDHRPVLADAGRLLPAARAGQRPRLQGEQPRWSADPATGHVPSGDRDGHHRGCGREPSSGQGRHADAWQGSRHRRARRAEHQHLADEQCARHDCHDDESQARARRR